MFARAMALFALLGFLASQLASVPHAHAGLSPDQDLKHNATPHIHVGWLGHEHDHPHASQHHHHLAVCEQSANSEIYGLDTDHDADVVYLGSAGPFGLGRLKTCSVQDLSFVIACDHQSPCSCGTVEGREYGLRPPNSAAEPVPLFLRLRTLRI